MASGGPSAGGGGGGGGAVSVQDLDPEQLMQVKEQLDQEIQHLSTSFTQLRSAQAKYSAGVDALDALKSPSSSSGSSSSSAPAKTAPAKKVAAAAPASAGVGTEGQGGEILVPLTPSLYVPGRLKDRESVMVDVGTGYFVEQPIPSARRSLNQKILSLRSNLEKLQGTLEQKQENQNLVRELLQMKVAAREREKERGGAAGQPVG